MTRLVLLNTSAAHFCQLSEQERRETKCLAQRYDAPRSIELTTLQSRAEYPKPLSYAPSLSVYNIITASDVGLVFHGGLHSILVESKQLLGAETVFGPKGEGQSFGCGPSYITNMIPPRNILGDIKDRHLKRLALV